MPFIPPLTIGVAGWLIGIGLAPVAPAPLWAWLSLSAVAVIGAWTARRRPAARVSAIALAMLGLGAARWTWAQPVFDESFIASYNDEGRVTLEGVVIDEPDVRDTYVNLRLAVASIQSADTQTFRPARGLVLVQAPRYPPIPFGERIRARGDLQTPPTFEDFSYKDYLAREGVFSILRQAQAEVIGGAPSDARLGIRAAAFKPILALKAYALESIARVFPEPQGALLSGILLGVESGIPQSLKEAFRVTGTSHIVAISGFNISIIAGIATRLFRRVLGERRSIPVAIAAILLYAILAGADASVVRAALMGGLVLVAGGFHRPANGLASLAAAAFIMTAIKPGTLWDVGFQLSAAATLGLIVYSEPLTRAAVRALARFASTANAEKIVAALGEYSILTVAAQITTLPLIAYYFRQLSLVSLAANLLILPVQPQVMILGGAAAIGAMIAPPLGALLFWLAWPFVTFTIAVVELLAEAPGAAVAIDKFPLWILAAIYAAIFALTWAMSRERPQPPQWWTRLAAGWLANGALAALAVGALAAWNIYLHLPDGKLHVTFLDVGHGDAVLIQTPSGSYALIDGGPSPNALAEALGRTLPLSVRSLDLVVAASPASSSIGGLTALFGRYEIKQVLVAGEPSRSAVYREWAQQLSSRSIKTIRAETDQTFDMGEGASLTILHTGPQGATLRLDYGRASFLFAIELDAVTATELALSGRIDPATVLLAPDHGGGKSISALFMDAANPSAVVVAVGAGNMAGDPQPETLALFEGRTILRSDQRGTITFGTDGARLWAEAEK